MYYVCRASELSEKAEELLRVLESREVPMTDLSSLFQKLKEECVEEGEQPANYDVLTLSRIHWRIRVAESTPFAFAKSWMV